MDCHIIKHETVREQLEGVTVVALSVGNSNQRSLKSSLIIFKMKEEALGGVDLDV